MYKVGDKVVYAEIKEGGRSKRFLFPAENGIIEKLKSFLNEYTTLFLIRHGEAEILSPAIAGTGEELFSSLTFREEISYQQARLYGHPETQNGQLRYSRPFVEVVLAQEVMVSSIPNESYVQTFVQPSAESDSAATAAVQLAGGVDELRAKLEASKPKSDVDPQGPLPPAQFSMPITISNGPVDIQAVEEEKLEKELSAREDLRAQLQKAKEEKAAAPYEEHLTLVPYMERSDKNLLPVSLVLDAIYDVSLRVQSMSEKLDTLVKGSAISGGVTAKELSIWFQKTASEGSWDQAFEILASKLKDLD